MTPGTGPCRQIARAGTALPHRPQAVRSRAGRAGPAAPGDRLPERRPDPPVRDRSLPGGVPGPLHPRWHGRGEHDRRGRGARPQRLDPVRAHVRRVRDPAPLRPDRQRGRLPAPAGPHHRLHARRFQPRRPQPPGHRGCRADARAPRHDRRGRGGRDGDRPGGSGHRRPAGPGLPAPQARRDPGDLPRRSPAVPRSRSGAGRRPGRTRASRAEPRAAGATAGGGVTRGGAETVGGAGHQRRRRDPRRRRNRGPGWDGGMAHLHVGRGGPGPGAGGGARIRCGSAGQRHDGRPCTCSGPRAAIGRYRHA